MSAQLKHIRVDDLLLDDSNTRLPSHLQGAADEKIIEYMLLQASTLPLMQAIGENGFFEGEQLLVVATDNGKFKVVEGNRRLTAVKLLRKPDLASVQQSKVQQVFKEAEHKLDELKEIPCLIFENEDTIHRYLGYRHVTGIQPWNLRQRARYLNSLREDVCKDKSLDEACRELAKMIGSKRDYVKRILVGFSIYKVIEENAFFRIKDLGEDSFYFNYIADSLNRSNIAGFLGVDLNHANPTENLSLDRLEQLTRWFFEKVFEDKTRLKGSSTDLSMFNAIVVSELALKAFDVDGLTLSAAYQLTEDTEGLFTSSIRRSITELERADSLTHRISNFYSDLKDDLRAIRRLARKINDAKEERQESEFEDDEL